MSAERVTYLDSSAIVKLVVHEPESTALRAYLRRRRPFVTSALARVEVHRALLPAGEQALRRGLSVLRRIESIRIGTAVLETAAALHPPELRSPEALHLATALQLGGDLGRIVTYDDRLADAARRAGLTVVAPR